MSGGVVRDDLANNKGLFGCSRILNNTRNLRGRAFWIAVSHVISHTTNRQ